MYLILPAGVCTTDVPGTGMARCVISALLDPLRTGLRVFNLVPEEEEGGGPRSRKEVPEGVSKGSELKLSKVVKPLKTRSQINLRLLTVLGSRKRPFAVLGGYSWVKNCRKSHQNGLKPGIPRSRKVPKTPYSAI